VEERYAEARGLFLTACATCHGPDGSGQGTTALDRPARSFRLGGFSFGNTPDAVARTITFGIPGTPMPAFGEAYVDRERRLLAEYVLSLGPATTEVVAEQTVMVVERQPLVVRGILPAIAEAAPLRPRGLVIGTPTGLSFEYRVDDVRLLGVRQGEFVARDDWLGRGGSPLRPLGTLVLLEGDGDPPATFSIGDTPLHAQITGTAVRNDVTATLAYRLQRENGTPLAHVEERIEPWADATGSGWTRHLALVGTGLNPTELVLLVVPPRPGREVRPASTPPLIIEGATQPIWFRALSEDSPVFHVALRTGTNSSGSRAILRMALGSDGGLRAHLRLEPEQLVELELLTFFRTTAPEGAR
jgi:hypothetical protein